MESLKCTCGFVGEPNIEVLTSGVHFAKATCQCCKRFIKFLPKPESEGKQKRPAQHRNIVKKFSRGFCEMCLIQEADIPKYETLEAHHVEEYQDGGEPTRENTWVLCTACHTLVNWRRTYTGHILQSLAERN